MHKEYFLTEEYFIAEQLCRTHWRARLFKGKRMLTVAEVEKINAKVEKHWVEWLGQADDLLLHFRAWKKTCEKLNPSYDKTKYATLEDDDASSGFQTVHSDAD